MDVSLRFLEKAEDRWTAGLCPGGREWWKFQKRTVRPEASLRAGRERGDFVGEFFAPHCRPRLPAAAGESPNAVFAFRLHVYDFTPMTPNPRNLARVATNILNPFAIFTALFAGVAFTESGALRGLGYLFLELLAASLVAGYVFFMRRRKRVGDFWISTRAERIVPAIFLLAAFAGLLFALFLFAAPESLFLLTLSMGVASGAVAAMTLLWKASAHSAVAGHAAVAGVVSLGAWGIFFVLILPAVIWSRVHLGAHTFSQTLAGASVGGAFALLFLA